MKFKLFEDDKYYYKQLYVDKRNKSNSEIGIENGLTEEQVEAIEWLCKIRHEMHSNQDDFFISESYNFSQFYNYVFEDGINTKLFNADLPLIDFSTADEFYDSDYDSDESNYDENYEYAMIQAEKINSIIEHYLFNIDTKYNTHYCPTGIARYNKYI